MTKVNLGVFTEIATEKVDRDLRNVDLTKTDVVIEYQEPTEENNYTWYRLYASGWVEQGGVVSTNSQESASVTFPIDMQDTNYTITISAQSPEDTTANTIHGCHFIRKDTTGCSVMGIAGNAGTWVATNICWQVSGKADMTGHEILPSKKAIDEYDHRVIAFQKPTAENNYTWYRKYADGWVEQGGWQGTINTTINLPIEMTDTNYIVNCGFVISNCGEQTVTKQTTSFSTGSIQNVSGTYSWEVKGMYKVSE